MDALISLVYTIIDGLEHWLGILDWLFVFSDNRKLLFCTCQKGKI